MNEIIQEPNIPIIGISCGSSTSKSVVAMWTGLRQHGSQPIILDHDIDAIDEQLPNLNAVIMMGNNYDISPDDYENDGNINARIPKIDTKEYDKYQQRCEYEKILAQKVIAEKIPLLGICGGMQRINVTPDPENPELKIGSLHDVEHQLIKGFNVRHDTDIEQQAPLYASAFGKNIAKYHA